MSAPVASPFSLAGKVALVTCGIGLGIAVDGGFSL